MASTLQVEKMTDYLPEASQPLVIAGPCSAETEEQVLATARAVAKNPKVSVLRAGIWKPRTKPGSFEGVGEPGLEWLKKAKAETGLKVTTEVANTQHVEAALKAGIDVLWIGARTTVSPFSVQEIADSLRGVDVPVYVKNPINPDLALWIGAMERFHAVGVSKLGAVHRGFSTFDKSQYRNAPEWGIPIEFRRQLPDVPMLCDPSHIAGNTLLIQSICQKALDLTMDGFIIETHTNPKEAWSDAKQQITPDELETLLSSLVIRKKGEEKDPHLAELEIMRQKIDTADDKILKAMAERMNTVREIGEYKKEHALTALQISRWSEILNNLANEGNRMGLDKEFIKKVYDLIHQNSIDTQERIFSSSENPEQAK